MSNLPIAIKRKYKNGLTHFHYYIDRFLGFNIGLYVNAGSVDEKRHEQYGVAHFLEHMVFNGSLKYPSGKDLDILMGNKMLTDNAWTWNTTTCYFVKGPNKEIELAADILINRVLNPLLRKKDVEKERGIIIEELNRSNSKQEYVLDDKLSSILFNGTGYGHNILGDMKSLKGMRSEILREFHSKHYVFENMVLVTYGGVNISEVDASLSKHFSLEEDVDYIFEAAFDVTPKIDKDIEKLFSKKTSFIEIPFDSKNPSYIFTNLLPIEISVENLLKAQLLEILLGDGNGALLEQELVFNNSLVDSFNFDLAPFRNVMLFSFVVGSSSVNLPKIQKLFSQVIHSIFEGNITDEDFNRAKNYMLGQLFFGLDEVQIASLNSIYSTGYVFSNYKVFYDYGEIYKYVEGLEKSEFISFIKRVFSKYITGEGFIEGVIVVS